ncbi:hypothetical protein [Salinibacterium sp.]|uniref:hypothetical protein n=1 Tax=Salinibacterium sp. TaxID=1915057 RepID=UPI00286C183D|nr:hypothetical protein [Salinibacterium sp.]
MSTTTAPLTTATRRWRTGLILFGIALLVIGAITLLNDVAPTDYAGIAIWLFGALVIHDGLAALVIFGVSILMRRASRTIPLAVIAIIQGALAVGAIFFVIVVPAILKKDIGSANPSILPLEYGLNLVLFYVGLAMVTAAAIAVYLVLARRQNARPSSSQD